MRKHNNIARDLRTPKYRKRIVSDKRKYNRKKEDKDAHNRDDTPPDRGE